jgi:hypothetical protein
MPLQNGSVGEGKTITLADSFRRETDEQAILRNFPSLIEGQNYKITSARTVEYNCLAWVLGVDSFSYNPTPKVGGYFWPLDLDREWNLPTIKLLLAKHGYSVETTDRSLEPGWGKIALYCDMHGDPKHFALQLPSGFWTSKLGNLNDIEHLDLECLEHPKDSGLVTLLLKRKL